MLALCCFSLRCFSLDCFSLHGFLLRHRLRRAALVASVGLGALCHADDQVVDKVYHPYVDALTTEFSARSTFQDPQSEPNIAQAHQVALGHSIGARNFAELHLLGSRDRAGTFTTDALQVEVKRQLTEQGEYAADWAVLVEYESNLHINAKEFAVGLITEREFGRWSGTGNLFLINEWGRDTKHEFEAILALQARYRYQRELEPTLEFYAGQGTRAFGPVLQGDIRMGTRKKLHWESGVLFGLDQPSPTKTWRLLFEYDF
ncbi:MAG: hypothetical protein LBF16_09355 [Pseudomonadales bacterium]|jgi:hypothetical protein|nr:hypothetical protein [Pseudomonadales bacterium]